MRDYEERIKELCAIILRADRLYYVDARPELTDAEYDKLWVELDTLEHAHPECISADSPTQRVSGDPQTAFKKVRHNPPMRSLDKTYELNDLVAFDTFLHNTLAQEVWDYIVEPKVDGLSLSLLYEHGRLIRAATRGNGEVGDDITANVRTIRSIPLTIPTDAALVEVRGEIYMTRDGFVKLNAAEEAAGHEPFSNPRNAAAGSIKLLDPREVAKRPLDAVIYAAGALNGVEFNTHSEMMRTFSSWGLKTPPWSRLCIDMPQVMVAINELETLRHSFDFEMDGAVVKMNERRLYDQLGSTAHAPRSARAYKYAAEHVQTKLNGITVQVGTTGVLTPVAELEPVSLGGSIIARATLHNEDYIHQKDIRIGDTVWLAKAGDVIPAIESSVVEKRDGSEVVFELPKTCPVCGGAVIRLEGEVATRCTNPDCSAQSIGHLQRFTERAALDISALGTRMCEMLVSSHVVKDPMDLYSLTAETLSELRLINDDGTERKFGRRANDVVGALSKARELPLHRWLYALAIPGIGITASKIIASAFKDLKELQTTDIFKDIETLYAFMQRKKADITDPELFVGQILSYGQKLEAAGIATRLPDEGAMPKYILSIKPEMNASMLRFLATPYAERFFKIMEQLGINPTSLQPQLSSTALAGLTFVITGTLTQPREFFEEKIRQAGGTIQNSVSKKTRYVLIGENPGGSKYSKAQELNTPLLTEEDFYNILNGETPVSPAPEATPAKTKKPKRIVSVQPEDDLFAGSNL